MEPVVPSVFDEMEEQKPLPYAGTGKRFVNFIVDLIVFYAIFIVVTFIWAVLDQLLSADTTTNFFEDETLSGKLLSYFYVYSVFFIVYTLIEWLSKGRSLGKLITGTKAVRQDGSPITFKDVAIRSLCRMIPFEPLTGFNGQPLHDRVSKTVVVKRTVVHV